MKKHRKSFLDKFLFYMGTVDILLGFILNLADTDKTMIIMLLGCGLFSHLFLIEGALGINEDDETKNEETEN